MNARQARDRGFTVRMQTDMCGSFEPFDSTSITVSHTTYTDRTRTSISSFMTLIGKSRVRRRKHVLCTSGFSKDGRKAQNIGGDYIEFRDEDADPAMADVESDFGT